ncbi:MAG TPA: hypothetical protein HPP58_00170 [Deltaproteobacteria bacterium]|nr:hypothetical protein [Deltaproteobacteria bacterium]HIJ35666.1 hypothetical protein [Deltaproteobacteria bacterium]HIJ39459.1 hypothetical protein [Deltaproteobacteria bacterium]
MDDMKEKDAAGQALTGKQNIEPKPYWRMDQSELEEKKRLLTAENENYKRRIELLSAEVALMDRTLASIRENHASTAKQIREYPDRIESLKSKSDSLLAGLNDMRLRVKISREDEESTRLLRKTLSEEYENLINERAVLVKRIGKMENALDEISVQREGSLPRLKKYDELLREARNVFYDAESRMEVSMKLKQGRTACKLPNI